MRQHACFFGSCALMSLLAVAAANGQTFSYNDDFNSYANGQKPDGWNTLSNPEDPTLDPAVMTADTTGWSTQCTSWTNPPTPSGCSLYGATGAPAGTMNSVVNYGVAWSGGGRFNLIHAGMQLPGTTGANGWVGAAWYKGDDLTHHTGSYPLNLQTDALKVTFDLSVRAGNKSHQTAYPYMRIADGGVFAVLPVTDFATDITRISAGGGALGWGGLPGFAVEFDVYDNNNYNSGKLPQTINEPATLNPTTGIYTANQDSKNHLGLDVYTKWINNRLYSLVTEADPPLQLPPGTLPRLFGVGDNNQPVHFTVYFNNDPSDPINGGVGVVSVYCKVDPATKDPTEPNPPDPTYPNYDPTIGFGMQTGNPDGMLVMRGCIGAWPTPQAIFGFTGSIGGSNSIYQIDNLHVETNPISGTACEAPDVAKGTLVVLDPSGSAGDCATANLAQPGWDVQVYVTESNNLTGAKAGIAFDIANGIPLLGTLSGEPDINYIDNGCNGNLPNKRPMPGIPAPTYENYALLAKGWICFPPQDLNNPADPPYPRHYFLAVNSDDGFELVIGVNDGSDPSRPVIGSAGSRGCGTGDTVGTLMDLQVSASGVYPIQLLYFQNAGGGGVEFYRRFPGSLALIPPVQLVGTSQGGRSDQPLIWGLKNGQPAPDLTSSYTPLVPAMVELAASQKVGAAAGNSGLKIKSVSAPVRWFGGTTSKDQPDMYLQRDDAGEFTGLRYLDLLNDLCGGITLPTINIQGNSTEGIGALPLGTWPFPGQVAGATQFGVRAEGFITFPAAGAYYLGIDGDDDAWIRIGAQTIYSAGCCPKKFFALNVSDAGTYPIRIECLQDTGGARLKFYQEVPGLGRVAVNGPGSTVTLSDAASSGPYAWAPNGIPIPADRKVAEVGGGLNPGWNATLSKLPATLSALGILVDRTGVGTALYENDVVGLGIGLIPQATDLPSYLQYVDTVYTTPVPRFGATYNRSIAQFNPVLVNLTTTNADYSITALGYIEFPAAGDYGLNINSDDGSVMWIAGKIVTIFPRTTGYNDQTPAIVRITAPGLYDIRVDYFERAPADMMMVYQYLPSGTEALLNDPNNQGLKVYSDLAGPALTTAWRNPVRIPASAKAGRISMGGDPGFYVSEVNATFTEGNGGGGVGHEKFRNIYHASELLDAGLGLATSLNQYGAVVNKDMVVQSISFPDGTDTTGAYSIGFGPPGGSGPYPNASYFAARVTGLLGLKAGGHIFEIPSDDGFNFWIGDYNVGQSGSIKGNSTVRFYAWVPEDGLYPFKLDYIQGTGGRTLVFNEVEGTATGFTIEAVNTGNASKAYINILPCGVPRVDADGDGDVDLDDFGAFQACYTGDFAPAEGLSPACKCFDMPPGDGLVNATDLDAFTNCVTGPGVTWTQALAPNCTP